MKTLTQIAEDIVDAGLTSNDEGKVRSYIQANLPEALTAYICNDSANINLPEVLAGFTGSEPFACMMAAAKLATARERAIDDLCEKVLYRIDCLLDNDPEFPCPIE